MSDWLLATRKQMGLLAAILVVVLLSWWLFAIQGDAFSVQETARSAGKAEAQGRVATALPESSGTSAVEPAKVVRQTQTTMTAYAIATAARSKHEAYSALLNRAESGEIEFIFAVERIRMRCMTLPKSGELVFTTGASETVRKQADWQQSFSAETAYCGELTGLDERAAEVMRSASGLALARAKTGDRMATLYSDMQMAVAQPETEDVRASIAMELLHTTKDPGAVERYVSILLRSSGTGIKAIESKVFPRAFSEEQANNIRYAVTKMYACSQGLSCGGNTAHQRRRCLMRGSCAESVPVVEYMRRYELTESQYLMAQQYLQELQALLKKIGG